MVTVVAPGWKLIVLRGTMGGFRDDNFISGWVSGAGMSLSTNKDIGTFTNITGTPHNSIKNTVALASATYKYVTIKGHCPNNGFVVDVFDTAATNIGTVTFTSSLSTDEILQITLTAGNGTIGSIRVSGGALNNTCLIDLITIGSNPYLDLTNKLIGYDIDDILGWQTGWARLRIRDEQGFLWTSPNVVSPGDIVAFYESADGSSAGNLVRTFGGTIGQLPKTSNRVARETTLMVSAWSKALESQEVYQFFGGQTDDTIVGALIDNINTGSVTPQIAGWNLAKSIDQLTTVAGHFEWRLGIDVNRALTDISDYDGVQVGGNGADFWVSPAEVFHWHKILDTPWGTAGSFSDTPPSNDFIELNLNDQIYDIRTEMNIYGTISLVGDGDAWTESNDVWTNYTNTLSHSFASPTDFANILGTKVLDVLSKATLGSGAVFGVSATISPALDCTKIGTLTNPASLVFNYSNLIPSESGNIAPNFEVLLETSAGNYFYIILADSAATPKNLKHVAIGLGPNVGKGENAQYQWLKTGTPSWSNITKISFDGQVATTNQSSRFVVDGLDIQYDAIETAVDNRTGKGEKQFGRRQNSFVDPMPRPLTNVSATPGVPAAGLIGLRELAFIMLRKWRDPMNEGMITFDATTANAILAAHPGQKITLTSAHYNISAKDFRITAVHHHWAKGETYITVTLDITDFTATSQVRSPTDLWRELLQFDAVSRANYTLQQSYAIAAYNAGATPDVQKTAIVYTDASP